MKIEKQLLEKVRQALAGENKSSLKVALGPIPDSSVEDVVVSRVQILFRFWEVYRLFIEQKASLMDFLALLRQLIRTYGSMRVHIDTWNKIASKATEFNLIERDLGDSSVELGASDWKSRWLSGSENIDRFETRSIDESIAGDGLLASLDPNWITYRSEAQKAAVDAWMFAAPGTTTLVSLPTGSGKSLCTMLPPWYESRGGAIAKGTTIVIVPTVALAYDQQKQVRRFFPKARGDLFEPTTRTGATGQEERKNIDQAILDGTLPILYTSPESLLQSSLYSTCLKAAQRGLITRLVVDEAHLVETWGADFRVEFQLLATYRRLLLQRSGGQLKTLLLSATITPEGYDTLAQLFSEPHRLITVQANRLRNEIEYYFSSSYGESTRTQHVLEALKYLPRPAILYVTRPEQAETWGEILRNEGYRRVEMFHGETVSSKRYQLIQDWSAEKIDIMVATSAFGLGVDKRHVRTVIHATLPENLDRLYQEVGRGGRDGCRSISLVCTTKEDKDIARSLMPKRITIEKAYPRWQSMIEDAKSHVDKPDIILIDQDTTRKNAPTMQQNSANRDWNFRMLLMMQRAGMLEIADIPPAFNDDEEIWLPIRLLKPDIFNNRSKFEETFNAHRDNEIANVIANVENTFHLVDSYTRKKRSEDDELVDNCLALQIGRIYERSQLACSGCPTCRNIPVNQRPYVPGAIEFYIDYPDHLAGEVKSQESLDQTGSIKQKLGNRNQLTLTWAGNTQISTLQYHQDDISNIFWKGIEQIIYPEELLATHESRARFIKAMATSQSGRHPFLHRSIPVDWVIAKNHPVFALNTLVIYPTDPTLAQKLYERLQDAESDGIQFPTLLNLVHIDQRLQDGRKFTDVVDGLTEPIDWFVQSEEDQEDDFSLF